MIALLLKGLMIGFCIAAPVGPIGILCINRSLKSGFKSGFLSGCGAATADGVYGLIAGFGLTAISLFLIHQKIWIQWIGGAFLIYLGAKTLANPLTKNMASAEKNKTLLGDYVSTLFLTLTNPVTVLSFLAIFAGLGLGSIHVSYYSSALLVLGIVLGSLAWWLLLTLLVSKILHHHLNEFWLKAISKISGCVLIVFGIFSFFQLLRF